MSKRSRFVSVRSIGQRYKKKFGFSWVGSLGSLPPPRGVGEGRPRLGGTQYCCWQDPNAVASSDGRKKWPRVMKGFGQVSACAYYCSRCLVLVVDRLMWWRDASSTEYSMYELPNGDGRGKVPMMRIA